MTFSVLAIHILHGSFFPERATTKMAIEKDDAFWMGKAIGQAEKAAARGEVPIGAVVVRDGKIIARGHNLREGGQDPSAHAEMIAIRRASKKIGSWRLLNTTLYVTLEPCLMCMGAILLARVEKVVFGCYDPKGGAAGSLYDLSDDSRLNHRVMLVPKIREAECASLLSGFFSALRLEKKQIKPNR